MKRAILLLTAIMITTTTLFAGEGRILRYPNASKTQITFCHGGDIYVVERQGGLARKLTNSEGLEMFPRFSHDGNRIAFTAEYDGNREIYIMPSQGGEPQRLTYSMDLPGTPDRMGPDKIIMNWTKDDSKILYRSRHESWNSWVGKLCFVGVNGGLPEKLPLPRGGFASLSPDESKIAYNRVFREFRTWKRYRGGQADDIWIYDFKTKKVENITKNPAQDIIPMWVGNKIYFLSDRDHEMNIFCYDTETNQTRKITNFDKYDVKFPSLGADNIAFENGGYVYILDLATEKYNKVNIEISEDFITARNRIQSVRNNIAGYELSPDGKRALFCARGDIFTVPADKGFTKNLTHSSGVHERVARWSPDGNYIAFISDKSGEDEIYISKTDGSEVQQLTNDAKSYRFDLLWSPDSKKILCSDKSMALYFVDITSKAVTQVAKSKAWEIRDYCWSPDSKWIAFSDQLESSLSAVYLFSLENGTTTQVTDDFFNCSQPEFDKNGKYLFFVSDRTFRYNEGAFERSYTYNAMAKIYGLTLQKELKSPVFEDEPETAEPIATSEEKPGKKDKSSKKKNDEETSEAKDMNIEFDGLRNRIFELPTANAYYYGLKSVKDNKLYYLRDGLYCFDFTKKKESKVGSIYSYDISADEKNIMIRSGNEFYIQKLTDNVKAEGNALKLSDLNVNLNKKEEWKQIFDEGWRQMKYFFYDPNMHGVDWKAVHDKYAEMLPYVIHRTDLSYLMAEMIGELNCGHAYTGGGDMPAVTQVPIGLLGVDLVFESKGENEGFYKITKILKGRNWDEETRSPLTQPGIDIKEGNYIIAIDDEPVSRENTPYKLLVNKVGKYIKLTVNTKPDEKGAKDYVVKTIASEEDLRYFNWVENNRRIVDSISGGKIGYVHIPDMMPKGLNEFVKYFYPQIRKEALIIDDRYNGGGNVSPMIIERLRRILTMAGNARNQQVVSTLPDAVFTGPMVCLLNELSASDGDMFPYQFKQSGLGKLIGKRSWGGIIGIRGSLPFLDGGYLYKPEFGHFGVVEGTWNVEGHGVDPDIEVDNDPADEYNGVDAQLLKAIEVLKEEMKNYSKPKIPQIPPFPNKK